ncbi:MAG TPA: amidohydrolase family protein [Gemmatimonadales bacterium]|nr:amidohydrolase family protein [Gemmatimonadales bacterium]
MIRINRLVFGTIAGCLILAGCKPGSQDGIALVGATLIDGTGGPPLADAAVLVRRGKVESIGPRSGFELPRGINQVDVSGRWIIPGLIDAHAHLAQAAGWAPARYLAWGVTTVRDMHGPLNSVISVRRRSNSESSGSPRVYAAGAMIDGLPTTYPDAIGVNSEQDARKAVDRLVSGGVDFIKVYTHIDPPLLRAILDEAHTFNVAVAGHLGMTDALTAAKDGISSIEHLTGVPEAISRERSSLLAAHYRGFFPGWTAFERSWADLDSTALTELAARLAQERVTLVPTLILQETLSRLDDPAILRDSALRDVPEDARRAWDVPGMISRAGWDSADFTAFRRSRPMQNLFVRAFVAAGGRIATGTDSPNQLLVPGYSEHRELELLVAAGISPREALRAATRNAAVLLGVDSLGLIAPGKAADLIVLTRNPLADIRNTRSIQTVMSRGHLLDVDSIRATW